jgi:hypothetical protein
MSDKVYDRHMDGRAQFLRGAEESLRGEELPLGGVGAEKITSWRRQNPA